MIKLLYLFFLYSFLGWIAETSAVILKEKKVVNRLECLIDERFDDGRMKKIYPKAKRVTIAFDTHVMSRKTLF